MIRARRATPDTYAYDSDLLSVMMRARDDWGEGMLERHLRDEVLTLYLAGHDTTSELMCWAAILTPSMAAESTVKTSPVDWATARRTRKALRQRPLRFVVEQVDRGADSQANSSERQAERTWRAGCAEGRAGRAQRAQGYGECAAGSVERARCDVVAGWSSFLSARV
jgi:Cytochrome P450